ncbi:hypothetical protein EWM64_g4537 [Hericium alpestre]|uniref:Retrotransposon gag domain-containing protein n=1 Tax=Hericium alpestre TaxID=135208 RepID=A0A4Y9ZZ70_9AGAM|nr:hypothetical protein EWM64_g4537 [Hericium alpestre]
MADVPHWKTQPRLGGKWATTKKVAAVATAASSSAGTPESLSPMSTLSLLLSSLPSRPFDSPQNAQRAELRDNEMDSMPGSMPDAPLFGDTSPRAISPRDFLVYPKAESEPDSDFESAQDVKPVPSAIKFEPQDVKPLHIDLTYLGAPAPPTMLLRPASPNRLRLNRVPSVNSLTKPKSVVSLSSTVALPAPAFSTSFVPKPPSAPKLSAPQPSTKKKKKVSMSNSTMLRFRGDGKDGEDAQDFLHYFRREMRIGEVTDDHEKIKHMQDYIASGSRANRWYKANTVTTPASWQAFETAFTAEWPEIEESKCTPQEIQRKLLTVRIRETELGEKTNVSGKELWTHVAWAEKVLALAKEADMAKSDTYIWPVRKKLPDILKDKIPSTCADWAAFTTAVKNVDIDYLRDKVAKFRRENARIEDLNRRMATLEVRRPAAVSGRSAPTGGGNAANPGNSYNRPTATPMTARPPFTP